SGKASHREAQNSQTRGRFVNFVPFAATSSLTITNPIYILSSGYTDESSRSCRSTHHFVRRNSRAYSRSAGGTRADRLGGVRCGAAAAIDSQPAFEDARRRR